MAQRVGNIVLKAKWKVGDSKIYQANVFQLFFTPFSCSLYVGFVSPEDTLPRPDQPMPQERTADIVLLDRFSLDMEAFMRLKNEVDKTHKLLEEMGALKDAK